MRTGSKKNVGIFSLLGRPFYRLLELSVVVLLGFFLLLSKTTFLIAYNQRKVFQKLKTFTSRLMVGINQHKELISVTHSKLASTQKISKSKSPSFLKTPINLPRFFYRPIRVRVTLSRALSMSLFLVAILVVAFYFLILKDLPAVTSLVTRNQVVSTKILDRKGRLLAKFYKNVNRTPIQLNQLPDYLIKATIAIEDSEFYQHNGFSPKGILRSVKKIVVNQKIQGGSTITQQLVKNTLLTNERTFIRKIKEVILAILVELNFDKDQILQMYFNEVGYGGVAYGIEEASQLYFGKAAKDISVSQAALLAGLPASPTLYSPFGAHPELALKRQHQVLRRMVEEGFISADEAEAAKGEPLHFASQSTNMKAPHFVMYVKDILVKKYGETMVNQGGLEVTTSLDLDTQNLAQTAINQELQKLKRLNVRNAAALVTHPQTGEILAMVGSHDYFDIANDGQVNVTLRPRQPGSSIKPINYALALSNGFTPATIIDDSPITYRTPGSPPYTPQNYDHRFHGKVTVRQALASSYNVPAVKVLSHVGVSKMAALGQQMGISTWDDPSRFGLSLTLGGGEVKMVDMAVVYGTIANLGLRVDLNPILKITDFTGKHYPLPPCPDQSQQYSTAISAQAKQEIGCPKTRVLSPAVAYQLTDILSDNAARAPAFGTYSVLNLSPHQIAVKTGTTNNLRDNWAFGYTNEYLVATWVGNNDNTPMNAIASGITGASPIWSLIMGNLVKDQPPFHFIPPENLLKLTICPLTNTLTCPACPNPKEEYFLPNTEPKKACNSETIASVLKSTHPTDSPNRDRLLQGISTSP